MKRLLLLLIVLLGAWGCSRPQVEITGTILGADGQPPALAHVHVTPLGGDIRNPEKTVQAGEDGSFAVRLDLSGANYLQITAVGHSIAVLPVVLEEQESPIEVSVTLAPLSYKDTFDEVSIIGDWNNYSRNTAEPMTRQPDGTFLYERKTTTDTLVYQLLNITTSGRSVNGTMSDAFEYDGGGDYRSVAKVKDSLAQVVFDPEQLLRVDDPALPRIAFDEGHANLTRLADIQQEFERAQEQHRREVTAYRGEHGDLEGFQFDLTPLRSRLRAVMDSQEPLLVRQYAAVSLGNNIPFSQQTTSDSAAYVDIMRLVPPSSPLWGIQPYLPSRIAEQLNPDHPDSLVRVFVDENPDRRVRAVALGDLLSRADKDNDEEKARKLYTQLKREYSEVAEVRYVLKRLNPDRRIKTGKPVPEFEVQLMGSDEMVSSEGLKGRTYLLDFWASW